MYVFGDRANDDDGDGDEVGDTAVHAVVAVEEVFTFPSLFGVMLFVFSV